MRRQAYLMPGEYLNDSFSENESLLEPNILMAEAVNVKPQLLPQRE